MRDAQIKETLDTHFSESEVRQIIAFLEMDGGFSPEGELDIVKFFLRAHEAGKMVTVVLEVCKGEWDQTWSDQDPDARGYRCAPNPNVGVDSYNAILNLYYNLGIPLPKEYE